MWFDVEHAHSQLGWAPRWSNDEMFQQSFEWFVANRQVTNDLGASQHRRSAKQGLLSVVKKGTRLLPR